MRKEILAIGICITLLLTIFTGGCLDFGGEKEEKSKEGTNAEGTSDTSGSEEGNGEETTTLDTDNDGLTDEKENEIGTDPNNPNTDGDRYSDADEYNNKLPSYVKEQGKSPLFPAFPELKITLSNSYHTYLAQTITTTTESIESATYDYTITSQEMTTINWSNKLNVEVGYSFSNFGVSVKDEFNYASTYTNILSASEHYTMASAKRWSQTISTDLGDSYIYVTIYIKNTGSDVLQSEPSDIWLSLYIGEDSDPIKTWSFGSSYVGSAIAPINPGETRAVNAEFKECLTIDCLKRIDMGEPIRIEIQNCDLGDDRTYLQNAKDTLIQLGIDNGDTITTEYYKESHIGLTDFLTNHADMVMSGSTIQSIAGLSNTENGWWEIILPTKESLSDDINEVTIDAGDNIVLVYQKHSDNDGILDRDELVLGLNPNLEDTDNDGLNDDEEIALGTNPLLNDTDFDGLTDAEEVGLGIDPTHNDDTDGDGVHDMYDPDDDNDGMPDTWEETYGLDPKDATDASIDRDYDDLTSLQEYLNNTYPNDPDSDNDGGNDGTEVESGTDPLDPRVKWIVEWYDVGTGWDNRVPVGESVFYGHFQFNWGYYTVFSSYDEHIGFIATAIFYQNTTGSQSFTIGSDDGSRLYLDDTKIIDKWGNHWYEEKSESKKVTAGAHTLKMEYYENTGGAEVKFSTDAFPDGNIYKIRMTIKSYKLYDNTDSSGDDGSSPYYPDIYFHCFVSYGEKLHYSTDIYTEVTVDVEPNTLHTVSISMEFDVPDDEPVIIVFSMWDYDGSIYESPPYSGDDVYDIDGHDNSNGLTLIYYVSTGTWTGDDTDGVSDGQDDGLSSDKDAYIEYEIVIV